MAAIEERDGVRFHVLRTSPFRAIALARTPGFKALRPERTNGAPTDGRRPGAKAPGDGRVLIVSLGSTAGLRAADEELLDSLRRAGAAVEIVAPRRRRAVRTLALTDLVWALAARRARCRRIANASFARSSTPARPPPCSGPGRARSASTPLAAGNRRGRHGLWQRPRERRRLRSGATAAAVERGRPRRGARLPRAPRHRSLVLPVPSSPRVLPRASRDIAAFAYVANPPRRASIASSPPGLASPIRRATSTSRAPRPPSLRAGICLPAPGVRRACSRYDDYRALLRRARVFVCAPRREDYGIAQLEALADGCQLVTTPAPGPYVALPIARYLDPRLVGDDLAVALRTALDDPAPDHSARASVALAPFSRASVDRLVAEMLPRLLVRR